MEKKTKILIGAAVFIVIVIIVVFMARGGSNSTANNAAANTTANEEYVSVQSDGSKVNTSPELAQAKTIDGITISNIHLTEAGGMSRILADLSNSTGSRQGGFPVKITIQNKAGESIQEITGYIDTLDAGATGQLNTAVTVDVANAYNFTVEKK